MYVLDKTPCFQALGMQDFLKTYHSKNRSILSYLFLIEIQSIKRHKSNFPPKEDFRNMSSFELVLYG